MSNIDLSNSVINIYCGDMDTNCGDKQDNQFEKYNFVYDEKYPQPNSEWINKDSNFLYTVVCVTNTTATRVGWNHFVVYLNQSGEIWSRPLDIFLKNCDPMDEQDKPDN